MDRACKVPPQACQSSSSAFEPYSYTCNCNICEAQRARQLADQASKAVIVNTATGAVTAVCSCRDCATKPYPDRLGIHGPGPLPDMSDDHSDDETPIEVPEDELGEDIPLIPTTVSGANTDAHDSKMNDQASIGSGAQSSAPRAVNWNQTNKPISTIRTRLGGRSAASNNTSRATNAPTAIRHDTENPQSTQHVASKEASSSNQVDPGTKQTDDSGDRRAQAPPLNPIDADDQSDPSVSQNNVTHDVMEISDDETSSPAVAPKQPTSKENATHSLSSDQETSDYEDDHGVMLNVIDDNSGPESGEVSDATEVGHNAPNAKNLDGVVDENAQGGNSVNGSDRSSAGSSDDSGEYSSDNDGREDDRSSSSGSDTDGSNSDDSDSDGGDSGDEEGEIKDDSPDPMHTYSNSRAVGKHESRTKSHAADPSKPTTLADLNHDELRQQLRYFYLTEGAHTIPTSSPARCLTCMGAGHTAATCPSLKCTHCGSTKHFSHLCASQQICTRCRAKGHRASACPSPLAAKADVDLPCALCQVPGHIEARCETLWRTSGYPWTQDLPGGKADGNNKKGAAATTTTTNSHGAAVGVKLFCYECGKANHLGNDCPSRRPGKTMGTSSWSARASGGLHPTASMERAPGGGGGGGVGIGPKPAGNMGGRGKTGHHAGPHEVIDLDADGSDEDRMSGLQGSGGGGRGRKRPKLAPKGPGPRSGRGRGGANAGAGSGPGMRIAGLASAGGPQLGQRPYDDGGGGGRGRGGGGGNGRGGRGGGRGGGVNRGGSGGGGYGRDDAYYGHGSGGYRDRDDMDRYGRGRSRSPPRRRGGGGGGGGERYMPMPSAGRDAWRRRM